MSPAADEDDDKAAAGGTQRLDKWLWFIRVIKSRTQAAGLVTDGKVRINAQRVDKPSQSIKPGDAVTVTVRGHVRVLRVLQPGTRRGPPAEAQKLYEEVQHIPPPRRSQHLVQGAGPVPQREPGSGRPTKKERRQTDRLREPDQ
jgi:ribosome-associated heat shock protein Hsp15